MGSSEGAVGTGTPAETVSPPPPRGPKTYNLRSECTASRPVAKPQYLPPRLHPRPRPPRQERTAARTPEGLREIIIISSNSSTRLYRPHSATHSAAVPCWRPLAPQEPAKEIRGPSFHCRTSYAPFSRLLHPGVRAPPGPPMQISPTLVPGRIVGGAREESCEALQYSLLYCLRRGDGGRQGDTAAGVSNYGCHRRAP